MKAGRTQPRTLQVPRADHAGLRPALRGGRPPPHDAGEPARPHQRHHPARERNDL